MALEPYKRSIGVRGDAPSVNYSAPPVADASRALRGLGRSLLETAEPILRDKAERQAVSDAGKAPLVRDPETGALKRAEPLPGGGLVYREQFLKAANYVYRARLISESEKTFEEIRGRLADHPEEAWGEMTAHVQAVMQTVPDDIKADVEPDLLREMQQRFNGLTANKVERDRRLMASDLEADRGSILEGYLADVSALAEAEDWEGVAGRTATFNQRLQANQDARKAIGVLSDIGDAAEDEGARARTVPLNIEMQSIQSMQSMIERAPELLKDPVQLQLLEEWSVGDPSDGKGKVLGLTRDEYVKAIPDDRIRGAVSRWANKQLSDLDRAASEARASEVDAEKAAREQALLNSGRVLGDSGAASSPELRKQLDDDFNGLVLSKSSNITQFINYGFDGDPNAGMKLVMNVVEKNGYLPKAVEHYIVQNAEGGNRAKVLELTQNMLGIRGDLGQRQGLVVWRGLPARTRAVIERYRTLVDQGIDANMITGIMDDMAAGKRMSAGQVYERFKDNDGKPSRKIYTQVRDKWLKKIFGKDADKLPGHIRWSVDNAIPDYASVYGEDGEGAMRAAVEGVAAIWTPSPLGVEGYLPTELAGLQLTPNQLDRLFGNYADGQGWKRSGGFSKPGRNGLPTARLELADPTQLLAGVGNYRMIIYDERDGHVREVVNDISIDTQLARFFGSMENVEKAARQARIAGAKRRYSERTRAAEESQRYTMPVVP